VTPSGLLEPCAGKLACTVLKGPRRSNASGLPDRALRTPVVGRKNYYGSHAEWSAHLAARIWTITATAERHHHEPLTYLTDYLNACATAGGNPPKGPALQRILPWTTDTTNTPNHDPPHIINPDTPP